MREASYSTRDATASLTFVGDYPCESKRGTINHRNIRRG